MDLKSIKLVVLIACLSVSHSALAAQGETLQKDSAETWGWRTAMLTSLFLSMVTNPLGADEGSVSVMDSGAERIGALKVGFRWHPEETLLELGRVRLNHYYLFAYNYWQSWTVGGQEGVNNTLEFIPVFRFNFNNKKYFSFIETSVGAALFARTEMNDKQFSTNFQFTNSLAIGGYFNRKTSWAFQLQHYSNNSIKLPNNGINFYNFNLAYRY